MHRPLRDDPVLDKFRGVIIGCGGRAHDHAKAYQLCKQVELVAVADIVEERAVKFSERYGTHYYVNA